MTVTNFHTHINTVKSEFTDTHLIWTPHTCTVHTSCELVSAYVRYSRRTLWTILWPITDLEKSKDRIRLINATMAVRTLGHRKKLNYLKNEYQLKLWCSLHIYRVFQKFISIVPFLISRIDYNPSVSWISPKTELARQAS